MTCLLATLLVLSSGPLPSAYSRDQHSQHGANHVQDQQRSQSDTGRGQGNAKAAKQSQAKKQKKQKK
ncbi:MAG: hypothetical protein M3Z20_20325, partial [Chloroflexota bacterium]|nr:hypothetical protein [Chloroflexota bacterium]